MCQIVKYDIFFNSVKSMVKYDNFAIWLQKTRPFYHFFSIKIIKKQNCTCGRKNGLDK